MTIEPIKYTGITEDKNLKQILKDIEKELSGKIEGISYNGNTQELLVFPAIELSIIEKSTLENIISFPVTYNEYLCYDKTSKKYFYLMTKKVSPFLSPDGNDLDIIVTGKQFPVISGLNTDGKLFYGFIVQDSIVLAEVIQD